MEFLVGFAVPLLSQTSHKPKPRKAQYVANKEHQKVLLNRKKQIKEKKSKERVMLGWLGAGVWSTMEN